MGCGNSRVLAVQPAEERKSGWDAQGKAKASKDENKPPKNIASSGRDGSALSKGTMDSGLGLEDEGAGERLPGAVTETFFHRGRQHRLKNDLPLLNSNHGNQQDRERQKSSDILEELMTQGIIQRQTTFVKNGEAYDVLMDTSEKPLGKPPAKLEKLKTKKKKKKTLTREDIETKMKAAEERRKTKEEELKKRLRSDRPFPVTALQSIAESRGEGSLNPDEGQEDASTVPLETLGLDTLENVMTGPRQRSDEEVDEIDAVESDFNYNNPSDQYNSGNYIF
ncbi:hypothetical protein FKM82_006389 [Ascaphus truei]